MSAATPVLQPVHLVATEPDQAQHLLAQLYGSSLRTRAVPDTSWQLSFQGVDAGWFSSIEATVPGDLHYTNGGHDEQDVVAVGTVTAGEVAYDWHRPGHGAEDSGRYGIGDVYLGSQPGTLAAVHSHTARVTAITVPGSLLAAVAAAATGRVAGEAVPVPRFTTMHPAGPEAAWRWRRTTRYVDELLAEPTSVPPLLIGSLARLLASTALSVFPNTLTADTATTEATIEDRHDARPSTLRRAMAFIESHPEADITVADVARAAHVTPRAVQLAFRRHLNTTPLGHLRTVRLAQAHQELQAAVPGDGTTVTGVAARWGFTPSRFSEHYRAVYGVPPSQTLRT